VIDHSVTTNVLRSESAVQASEGGIMKWFSHGTSAHQASIRQIIIICIEACWNYELVFTWEADVLR
jgi:hypothetical protein